jgi:hypothetical protein
MSQIGTFSRDALRGLKASVDEENRLLRIGGIVGQIHTNVVNQARTTKDTKYRHDIPMPLIPQLGLLMNYIPPQNEEAAFYKDNMKDILDCLQELFPGCSVKFTSITMAMGNDGTMHDVSNIDKRALPFINNPQKNSYIIVDWS